MNRKELPPFTPIFDVLLNYYGKRKVLACLIYGKVWRYSQMKHKVCKASIPTLARELSCGYAAVFRGLKRLVKDGFIVDLTPDRKRSVHEYVVTDKLWELETTLLEGVDATNDSTLPKDSSTLSKTVQLLSLKNGTTPLELDEDSIKIPLNIGEDTLEGKELKSDVTLDKHSAQTAEHLSDLPSRSDILHSKNSNTLSAEEDSQSTHNTLSIEENLKITNDIRSAEENLESSISEDYKPLDFSFEKSSGRFKGKAIPDQNLSSGDIVDPVGSEMNSEKTPETEENNESVELNWSEMSVESILKVNKLTPPGKRETHADIMAAVDEISEEDYAAQTPISEENWSKCPRWQKQMVLGGRGRTFSYLEYLAFLEFKKEAHAARRAKQRE